MAWIDDITQSLYNWVTQLKQDIYSSVNHDYSTPEDDGEDDEDEWYTITEVVCGTPLRETKCLFVPEINDFYSDSELNTTYHSADEYRNAVKKYGLIYKSQKFQNADTTQKLLDYAKDWIKNNYHGGITNFSITALDMHNCGVNVDKYTVGQLAEVRYIDPYTRTEVGQTLTVISAEYDLNNPENNSYKIGIPDVTLNKVYGETSKSGGGGGGGGKPKDEADDETDTELDTLGDNQDSDKRDWLEFWANLFYKGEKNDATEEEAGQSFGIGNTETPGDSNPTGDWVYGLTGDIGNFSNLRGKMANIASVAANYIKSSGGLDADKLSANLGNITSVNSDTLKNKEKIETKILEAAEDVKAKSKVESEELVKGKTGEFEDITATTSIESEGSIKGDSGEFGSVTATTSIESEGSVKGDSGEFGSVTATTSIESSGSIKGDSGEFTTLTKGGKSVATEDQIPTVPTQTVSITVDNVRYIVYGRRA